MQLPSNAFDHPAVRHLDQLVEAVRRLGVPAHLRAVVTNTMLHTYVSLADETGTLVAIDQAQTSAHQKLLMTKHLPTVLDRARDWYHATQTVPGLADLCGEGSLTVAFPEGVAHVGWEPRVRAEDRVHSTKPPEPRLLLSDVLTDLAQAIALAPESVFDIKPIFLFFSQYQNSGFLPPYGLVHATPAMVRAMERVLANPSCDEKAPYLVLTKPGKTVGSTLAFHKARISLPRVSDAVVDGVNRALERLTAYLKTSAPPALHRIEFEAHPSAKMVAVHHNDAEDRDENAPLLPPFTDAEQGWLKEVDQRWSALVAALPTDGYWTCFGLTAVSNPEKQGLSFYMMGKGLKSYKEPFVPRCWLMATRGHAAIVRTHRHSSGYPSRGKTLNAAAALVVNALQNQAGVDRLLTVYWVLDA